MGVNRLPIVGMGVHLVASLSNCGKRIHMHRHLKDMGHVVHDLVANLLSQNC